MNRKKFIKSAIGIPVASALTANIAGPLTPNIIENPFFSWLFNTTSNPNNSSQNMINTPSLSDLQALPTLSKAMPALFVGHGSPMNAIETNIFSQKWKQLGETLPTPIAILCISAHWETYGTKITAMDAPKTIHDFGGFPPDLFAVQYPVPGSPTLASVTQELIKPNPIDLDHSWGLDHGCWSVIRCMYPKANIPVLQLSLDRNKSAQQHLDLAKELIPLRKKGVMIVGSGNIVHNLGRVAWDRMNEPNFGFDWAEEARAAMKNKISNGDSNALANPYQFGKAWELSIPTPEHYLPLLYTLGTQLPNETPAYFNDQCVLGSLAMTSFILGDA